jgi:hypothetical protein
MMVSRYKRKASIIKLNSPNVTILTGIKRILTKGLIKGKTTVRTITTLVYPIKPFSINRPCTR